MAVGKRLRGFLLRLALNRRAAIGVGLFLLTPALWLTFTDQTWEGPVSDGLTLILGATALALLLAGLGGRRPDWLDRDETR